MPASKRLIGAFGRVRRYEDSHPRVFSNQESGGNDCTRVALVRRGSSDLEVSAVTDLTPIVILLCEARLIGSIETFDHSIEYRNARTKHQERLAYTRPINPLRPTGRSNR